MKQSVSQFGFCSAIDDMYRKAKDTFGVVACAFFILSLLAFNS